MQQMALLNDIVSCDSGALSDRDIYQNYIRSPQWKRLREAALKKADYQCERCGASRWSGLEVHHKHYDNFQNESLSDLEVLCRKCHAIADQIRPYRYSQEEAAMRRKVESWAAWKYGNLWRSAMTFEQAAADYWSWRESAYA